MKILSLDADAKLLGGDQRQQRVVAYKLAAEMFMRTIDADLKQARESNDHSAYQTVQTELHLKVFIAHLRDVIHALSMSMLDRSLPALVNTVNQLQVLTAELSAELVESKVAGVSEVWLGEPDEPLTEEDQAKLAAAEAEHAKAKSGQPFDVEVLFGGVVPTFAQLPRCPADPCPACDARRDYFAAYKVH